MLTVLAFSFLRGDDLEWRTRAGVPGGRRRERGPVSVLSKVSKRWHACLKKRIDIVRAEIARLEAHRAFLEDARDKVYNIRVSQFGEPYRSDY